MLHVMCMDFFFNFSLKNLLLTVARNSFKMGMQSLHLWDFWFFFFVGRVREHLTFFCLHINFQQRL